MSNISVSLPRYFGFCEGQDFCEEQEEEIREYAAAAIKEEFGICASHNFAFGASKLVVVPDENLGRVIKFPFCCSLREVPYNIDLSVYEEEEDYVIINGKSYWYNYFTKAYGSIKNNYCNSEIEIYKNVPDEFKCLFAKVEFIDRNNIEYYTQETCITRYDIDEDREQSDVFYSRISNKPTLSKKVKDVNEYTCTGFDDAWLAYAEDFYGEDFIADFLQWIYDSKIITDMHDENYGFSLIDNRPVIIDFAGYNG